MECDTQVVTLALRVLVALCLGLAAQCAPVPSSDLCHSTSLMASKFFLLDELVFFTDNADRFEAFRTFNLSSGSLSNLFEVGTLIPDFLHNEQDTSSQSLLWAFRYDVMVGHCLVNESFGREHDRDQYCGRVSQLKGLVVGCLSSRKLVFLRHNMGKLVLAHDQNNFLEIHAVVKHLDRFGYISSLTFDQRTDYFVSTHYGLLLRVCMTVARHRTQCRCFPSSDLMAHVVSLFVLDIVPLPLMEEIISDHLFFTECLPTVRSYTSVIDLHGQLYASTSTGSSVDLIQPNHERKNFEVVQSVSTYRHYNQSEDIF